MTLAVDKMDIYNNDRLIYSSLTYVVSGFEMVIQLYINLIITNCVLFSFL